jgi:uncharacterized membrane protein
MNKFIYGVQMLIGVFVGLFALFVIWLVLLFALAAIVDQPRGVSVPDQGGSYYQGSGY